MSLYPIHVNLQGRLAVIIGAGPVAERKVTALRAAGARARLVAPEATPALQRQAGTGEIEWRRETYGPGHLDEAFLVIACTDNGAVNAAVTQDAQARNLLVLCADDPDAGSFVSPTQITRGDLIFTVSTGGRSPTLAAVLRERLEAEFGPEWGPLTALLGAMREWVKTNPTEAARKAAVRRVLDDPLVRELLADGNEKEAEIRVRQCLSSSSE